MKNFSASWKTTSAGLLSICGSIVGFIFAVIHHQVTEAVVMACITGVVTGIGLLTAKDGDVTGGTKDNGQTPV